MYLHLLFISSEFVLLQQDRDSAFLLCVHGIKLSAYIPSVIMCVKTPGLYCLPGLYTAQAKPHSPLLAGKNYNTAADWPGL